jgi:hypothetical protein
MTRHITYGLCFALLASVSCNTDRIEGGNCTGDDCNTTPPGNPPPGPGGPDQVTKVGPGGTPFDPAGDGSTGVKKDPNGNIVLDPGKLGSSRTPIIWVANSGDGTVSKIETRTLKEVGRYYTHPGGGADPSRSTVSLEGDAVIANRSSGNAARASAVYIYGDESRCEDRNKNGKIDTSRDSTPIPWPDGQFTNPPDECIRWIKVLDSGSLPRAAGFDAGVLEGKTNVYIGLYGRKQVLRLDANTGAILKTIDVTPCVPYGLVLDKNSDVWVRCAEGSLTQIQVNSGDKVVVYNGAKAPPCPYGIAADAQGRIYTAGAKCVSRFDPMTQTWQTLDLGAQGATFPRGLAVDSMNQVWVADTGTGMYHVDASGPQLVYKGKTPNLSSNNVGAAIDFDNNPWVISYANSKAYKVDRATYKVQEVNVGRNPYTYSDMTGYQLRNAGAPSGIWRHTFQGCSGTGTQWFNIDWKMESPPGTLVTVRIRTAKDKASLASATWTQVAQVKDGASTPPGVPPARIAASGIDASFLQVEFIMKSGKADITPILSSVTAGYSCFLG